MSESMSIMVAFALKSLGLLLIVMLIAVATPKIAKFIEKHSKPKEIDPNDHSKDVLSPFESRPEDKEIDLNSKIYTDIYAFPTKNKKEQAPKSEEHLENK